MARYTVKQVELFVNAIRAGNYLKPSLAVAGIPSHVYYDAKKRHAAFISEVGQESWSEALAESIEGRIARMTEEERDKGALDNAGDLAQEAAQALGAEEVTAMAIHLVEATQQAEAEAEVRIITQIQAHANEDWKAGMELLSRRHPDKWGKQDRHIVSGEDGGAIKVEANHDTARRLTDDPEARKMAAELLAKIHGDDGTSLTPELEAEIAAE